MKFQFRKAGWVWAMLVSCLLFFSSCINIEEYYHFNRDGSGSMWIKMDVSSMMAMMGGLMSLGDENENSETPSMDELFDNSESLAQLKEIPGISNIKSLSDQEEGIVGYSFDFKDITALNNSLSLVSEDINGLTESKSSSAGERSFDFSGKKMTVNYPDMSMEEDEEPEDEMDASMEEMMRGFMEDYTYKVTYHFDQSVKKAKNKEMEIAADKKSVVIEKSLLELMDGEGELGGLIKLKK